MTESEWRDNMSEHAWFCIWMVAFAIIYCAALAWPIVSIFIWELEEKIVKMFKKNV